MILKDKITINGTEYTKSQSMGMVEGIFFDNMQVHIHRKNVEIAGSICLCCSKKFLQSELTKHHVIPRKYKSKFNVFIPLCRECHDKIDGIVHKEKKDENSA